MQTPAPDSLLQPVEENTSSEIQSITEMPTAPPDALERLMVQNDKLPVVLAVVLVIWFGLLFFLFRTDRRLTRIEQNLTRDS